MGLKQLPPHLIQGLPHSEVETPIHRALRPPAPELPGPSRAAANPTLAPFHLMLPQRHNHTCKQSNCLFVEVRWHYLLPTSELVGQFLKVLQK